MSESHSATFELRPMGIGDILDTTLRLYRRNFVTFLSISLITYVPYAAVVFLLQMVFSHGQAGNDGPFGAQASPDPSAALVNLLGTLLFFLLVYPLTGGALTHAIAGDFLGRRLSAGDAYRRAFGRVGALIWTQLLVGMVVIIGLVLLIVPGIVFSLWFMIVPVIVMLEGVSGSKAMGRGRLLMKGNLRKGFSVNFVTGLLVGVTVGAATFGVAALVNMLQLPPATAELVANLLNGVFLPVQLGVIVLLYYDLRVRKEAFDLEVLSASLPEQPSPA